MIGEVPGEVVEVEMEAEMTGGVGVEMIGGITEIDLIAGGIETPEIVGIAEEIMMIEGVTGNIQELQINLYLQVIFLINIHHLI